MAKKLFRLFFYVICALMYNYGLYYNFVCCIFPQHNGIYESTIDKLQYLTNWDSVRNCRDEHVRLLSLNFYFLLKWLGYTVILFYSMHDFCL